MSKVEVANKLTVAGLGLTKEFLQKLLADKAEGDTVVVASIFGKATSYDAKQSKLDPTREDIAFKGEFEGVNMITGEVVNAPKAYLPGAAEGATKNAIDQLGEGEAVIFGCEIAVKKKASSAVGYVFGVSVPKHPTAQDPLAEIREQMKSLSTANAVPALEAPKAEKPKK